MLGGGAACRAKSAVGFDVDLVGDHGEGLVELDVDLRPVVEGHLHLVVAVLVADLGLGDPALASVGQRGVGRTFQRVTGDRRVAAVVVRLGGDDSSADGDRQSSGGTDADELGSLLRSVPPWMRASSVSIVALPA